MNDEQKKDTINPSTDASPETEKTPYQLYLEEKAEREKLQKKLNDKDLEYQKNLIRLDKKVSELSGAIDAKDKEMEINKEKYWVNKEADYKETVNNRHRTQEGIIVNSIYDILDKRTTEGEHLKRQNVFHI